jgi:hypothetical protein
MSARIVALKSALLAVAAGAGLTIGLGGAIADPPPFPPPGMHDHGPMGPRGFERECENIEARTAGHLAFAKVKLGITDSQKTAWDDFEGKVAAANAPIEKLCQQAHGPSEAATLPERLGRMDEMMSAHAQQIHALHGAVEAMYAQLTPAQKQAADKLMEHHHEGHWQHPGPDRDGPPPHP